MFNRMTFIFENRHVEITVKVHTVSLGYRTFAFQYFSPPRWRRGSGLDCGSEDPGLIPSIPSPRVDPLMAKRLKTSSDCPVPVSG